MISDPALLALIIDDHRALSVLAAWGALAPMLADIDDPEVLAKLARLAGIQPTAVPVSLMKLRHARVILDGGISDLADKLLQSRVQASIDRKKRK